MQKAHGLKVEMEVGMAGGGLVWFGLVWYRGAQMLEMAGSIHDSGLDCEVPEAGCGMKG
jgi:hypothetical protein